MIVTMTSSKDSLPFVGENLKVNEENNILLFETPSIREGAVSAAKNEEINLLIDKTSCRKVPINMGKSCTANAIMSENTSDLTSEKIPFELTSVKQNEKIVSSLNEKK